MREKWDVLSEIAGLESPCSRGSQHRILRYIRDVKAGFANTPHDVTSYSCMFCILLCCCEIGL